MSHTLQDILSIYKETEGLGYNKIPHELRLNLVRKILIELVI